MQMHRPVHRQKNQDFTLGKTEELRQYPWGYGAEALANYQFFARLHTRLFPYIYTYARICRNGLGDFAPLILINQSDPKALGVEHAYHFGNEFLVAPIVALNANSAASVFASGKLVDFWTALFTRATRPSRGAAQTACNFPIFVPEGAIVPLLPKMCKPCVTPPMSTTRHCRGKSGT